MAVPLRNAIDSKRAPHRELRRGFELLLRYAD